MLVAVPQVVQVAEAGGSLTLAVVDGVAARRVGAAHPGEVEDLPRVRTTEEVLVGEHLRSRPEVGGHFDADLLERGLGDLELQLTSLVAGRGGPLERGPHAVALVDAVAALDAAVVHQQRFGRHGVVVPLAEVIHVVGGAGHPDHVLQYLCLGPQRPDDGLDDRLAVDAHCDGLSHPRVGEQRIVVVEVEVLPHRTGAHLGGDARNGVHLLQQVELGLRVEHVDLPAAQRRHLGLRLLDERDHDLLHIAAGFVLIPVDVVPHQRDVLVLGPRLEHERTGPQRDLLVPDLVEVLPLQLVLGEDRLGPLILPGGVDLAVPEAHRLVVDGLGRDDLVEPLTRRDVEVGVHDRLPREDEVVGGHRHPIGPRGIGMNVEGDEEDRFLTGLRRRGRGSRSRRRRRRSGGGLLRFLVAARGDDEGEGRENHQPLRSVESSHSLLLLQIVMLNRKPEL